MQTVVQVLSLLHTQTPFQMPYQQQVPHHFQIVVDTRFIDLREAGALHSNGTLCANKR
jgi:hypothetical protein